MQQEKALAILKSGKNVFLTGSAGTGKTYILNQYITYLKERKVTVAITASTGIAATHMNGMTIHSWSGIGVKEQLTSAHLNTMKSKKYLTKNFEKVKVLIIDEISMLHKKQLNMVDTVLKYFKDNSKPFGGVQLVLCGDFFQLPPISRSNEMPKDKFAFMSEAWVQASLSVCYLTQQYRQSDNSLNNILNQIRGGSISTQAFEELKQCNTNHLQSGDSLTQLFTHNIDVDRVNFEHLLTLTSKSKTYRAKTKGNAKLKETLINAVLAPENLELKIGAKVMFVKNNLEKGYVNGSLGKVIGFTDEGLPSVKLTYNQKVVKVEPEDWSIIDDNGKMLANFNQIPLRLAWAITVHKCQGMTLDEAEIDLSKTFENGQGYVALSRLKRIENLKLLGLNEQALKVDGLAYKADQRFKELSEDTDNSCLMEELNIQASAFIRDCGGLVNKEEITANKNKLKEKEKGKISTYQITLMHLKQSVPIEKIAKIRGLTVGTISGHLIKIRKDNPDVNLNFYKPKNSIIKKVKAAYDQQEKGKPISLSAIYEQLEGKISYEMIKLAIAFMD